MNRRTVLAGLAVAGFGMMTRASTASAAVTVPAGAQLWRCGTPAGLTTLVAAPGVVCAGIINLPPNGKNGIYAIDAATGREAWTQWAGPIPTTAGSGIVYCDWTEGIIAVSTSTGKVLWETVLDQLNAGDGPGQSRYDDGVVYTAVQSDATPGIAAVSGQTGKKLWFARTPHSPSAPTVAASTVYTAWQDDVVYGTGELAALDAASGARLWTTQLSGFPTQFAVTGGVVAGIMSGVATVALDVRSGEVLWQSKHSPTLAFAAGNGVVYTSAGPLAARDARTGRYLWRQSGNEDQPEQLILAGDTLYAAYGNLQVRAVSAATGSSLWSHTLPASRTRMQVGIMVAGNSAVYLTLENPATGDLSNVYAIKA
jgi:outer membrane protein assembly factor BamB